MNTYFKFYTFNCVKKVEKFDYLLRKLGFETNLGKGINLSKDIGIAPAITTGGIGIAMTSNINIDSKFEVQVFSLDLTGKTREISEEDINLINEIYSCVENNLSVQEMIKDLEKENQNSLIYLNENKILIEGKKDTETIYPMEKFYVEGTIFGIAIGLFFGVMLSGVSKEVSIVGGLIGTIVTFLAQVNTASSDAKVSKIKKDIQYKEESIKSNKALISALSKINF